MALVTRTFIVDPSKTELRRDHSDSRHSPARFDIRILNTADLTGVVLTVQSPVPGAAAITLTAGAEFPATAPTRERLAELVLAAIDRETNGLLNLNDPIDPDFLHVGGVGSGEPGQSVFAPRPGAWGEEITLEVNATANAVNIEVNGVANAVGHTENGIGGSGARGTTELEAALSGLNAPGGGAPEFVSLSQSTLASGEVHYTLISDE